MHIKESTEDSAMGSWGSTKQSKSHLRRKKKNDIQGNDGSAWQEEKEEGNMDATHEESEARNTKTRSRYKVVQRCSKHIHQGGRESGQVKRPIPTTSTIQSARMQM